MSKLQELIARLCPDGVPYTTLNKVSEIQRGVRVVKNDLTKEGSIPVFQNSLTPLGYYDKANYPADTTFVIGAGAAGDLGYSSIPYWGADDCYSIICSEKVISKYVYYIIANNQIYLKSRVRKASIPRLARTAIESFPIPVPPLEVQEEIVRILDRFSDYAAELQAELQARKEQYEYYRNLLLAFNPSAYGVGTEGKQEIINVSAPPSTSYKIEWKTISDICKIIPAPRKLNRQDYSEKGTYPIIDQGQDMICGYSDLANAALPKDEYVLFGDHTKNIKYFNGTFIQGADGLKIIKTNNEVIPKFLYHSMKVLKIEDRGYNRHWPVVAPLTIPIPPLEVQEKIVAILDRFETLVNDLSQGLPAEIAAVRERYEYYRNKLLTFKQLA